MTEPNPVQVARRAARQAVRAEAARQAREARLQGRPRAQDLALARADRQALRRGVPMSMAGWVTPTGEELPADEAGNTLPLTLGAVATRDPAIDGVVNPTQAVIPGLPYTVAVTTSGVRVFVGLQWVNQDGTTNPAILWGKGPGRVVVTGTAPDTAKGVRALLVCYSVKAEDLAGRDTATRVIQQNLRQFVIAQGADQ